jgi:hypothetical protein
MFQYIFYDPLVEFKKTNQYHIFEAYLWEWYLLLRIHVVQDAEDAPVCVLCHQVVA